MVKRFLPKNLDKSVEIWSGETEQCTQSRDTNQKRRGTCGSDWHGCDLSTGLISGWACCSTGSIQLGAHKEWMGADWQKHTRPLWWLTSAAMVAPHLMLWGSPLERPSWAGMCVIFNKSLPASQHLLTQWPLPEGLEDFFHTKAYYHIHDGSVGTLRGIQAVILAALTLKCALHSPLRGRGG